MFYIGNEMACLSGTKRPFTILYIVHIVFNVYIVLYTAICYVGALFFQAKTYIYTQCV